jgi:putative tryptophan/tyrosine transport system substrate-binding protein
MRRREFLGIIGGAAAFPLGVQAEPTAKRVVGFLSSGAPEEYASYVAAFGAGFGERGYVEGRNVTTEFRWARAQSDRLPRLTAELVKAQVAVIAGLNSTPVVRAAKAATTTIPLVFAIGADPVKVGLVESFSRPGGNVTGISFQSNALLPKRLELLRELVPRATKVGFLANPRNPNTASDVRDTQAAAHVMGLGLEVANAAEERDLETAFKAFSDAKAQAVLIDTDPLFTRRRERITVLAAQSRIPVLYDRREFVAAGGLLSYGSKLADTYREMGISTARILGGDQPAQLPIMQPTKFELVVNVRTAKLIGVDVPPTLLARADDVIE